ncbi:LacI family DNA-binding transcriptional regulator [Anaerotalea alkaliphila]|uniref:LacI family transcriptional regulator n=1 Tax=Anaerotalea alkaliphila TaxID=2662126 RepID=A0A7X5HY61_9FIRM|nr:LacI family DNA-binding transcriptional regulator [Anaerotalea alkaliphila]NDL68825.1 LacI family transcriptional regulator [Anaerotalea alkaliphila]
MKRTIRLKDVAQMAGVGVGTASRVLNGHSNVSPEKREKVLAAIQALGYRPNEIARSLKARFSRTVGVILMDIANPFYTDVVRGIEDCAARKNYSIILADLVWEPGRLQGRLEELKDKKVDGILYMGSAVTREDVALFHKEQMPVVFLSTAVPEGQEGAELSHAGWGAVNIDNGKAAYEAAKYLLGKGYRSIGLISGEEGDRNSSVPREAGLRQALAEEGLDLPEGWRKFGKFSYAGAHRAMEELLEGEDRPQAVFALSDVMAMGAAKAALARGLEIPGDVAVLGFDGIEGARYFHPSITTVAQPRYEMGVRGMEDLIALLEGGGGETSRILDFVIVEGEST